MSKATVAKLVVGLLSLVPLGCLAWWISPLVRATVIEQMAGIDAVAVPLVRHGLHDQDPHVRQAATRALKALGTDAVAPLADSLGDSDETVRFEAAYALGMLGTAADDAVPALVSTLKKSDEVPTVRARAARSLCHINPDGAGVFEALGSAAKHEVDGDARAAALGAMYVYCLRPKGKELVPELIAALGDPHPRVREQAADCLAAVGPAAKQAVPALKRLRNDPDPGVRREVEEALEKIEPDADDEPGRKAGDGAQGMR